MSSPATRALPSGVRLSLRRRVLGQQPVPALDSSQRAVVEHRDGPLRVIGAPGTGKTTALVEAVVARVDRDGLQAGEVLVLAPTRVAAARLRELVTARLGRTVTEPLARTPASFAFGVLRQVAVLAGEPPPRLIAGPEQDLVLRELLAGHALGEGAAPGWPPGVSAALGARGFRTELRDLLMRAVERGLDDDELARLGREHDRPDWVAAATVLGEYLGVTGLATPGAYDPASIAGTAAGELAVDDDQVQPLGVLDIVVAEHLAAGIEDPKDVGLGSASDECPAFADEPVAVPFQGQAAGKREGVASGGRVASGGGMCVGHGALADADPVPNHEGRKEGAGKAGYEKRDLSPRTSTSLVSGSASTNVTPGTRPTSPSTADLQCPQVMPATV